MIAEPPSTEIREVTPVDRMEAAIAELPPAIMSTVHLFTPGLYVRQLIVPAGTMFTGLKHKSQHPFILIGGVVEIIDHDSRQIFEAPHMGITLEGTKRVAFAHTEVTWLTIHANPNDITNPDEIVSILTEEFDNPLFEDKTNPRINSWRLESGPSYVFDGPKLRTEKIS